MIPKYWVVLSTDVTNPLPNGLPLWKFTTHKGAVIKAGEWAAKAPGTTFVVLEARSERVYPLQPQLVVEACF